jgi:hypothetical protein
VKSIEFTLDDGTALLIVDPVESGTSDEADVLGPSWDYLGEAVLSGVSVQLTWATLKGITNRIRAGGLLRSKAEFSAADVTQAIKTYLESAGFSDVEFVEVEKVGDDGWRFAGRAGGEPFTARADPSGQVVHVRLGT